MTPQEVVKFAQDNNCKMVDYKFLDFVGIWQHFSTPIGEFGEDIFEEGMTTFQPLAFTGDPPNMEIYVPNGERMGRINDQLNRFT